MFRSTPGNRQKPIDPAIARSPKENPARGWVPRAGRSSRGGRRGSNGLDRVQTVHEDQLLPLEDDDGVVAGAIATTGVVVAGGATT